MELTSYITTMISYEFQCILNTVIRDIYDIIAYAKYISNVWFAWLMWWLDIAYMYYMYITTAIKMRFEKTWNINRFGEAICE